MFALHLLTVAVVTATLVSASQPGTDYDVYKTTNLYNCTGRVSVSNVTVRNAADTLPQIAPVAEKGWEQWSLFLHGTFPIILRWNQGDPSSSVPSPAHFDVFLDLNGTTVRHTVVGNLSYTDSEHAHRIAIGDNVLSWDTDALWYNVSAIVDGYQLTLNSSSATRDAFHPNVAFHNGLLDQTGAWFGSVPLIRGQVSGSLSTPAQKNTTLDGLSVLRHMFSENPLPDYIDRYTGGTVWGYSNTFYDTHVFYQTEKTNGTVHEAAYLARSIPAPSKDGTFSSTWATYAVTDDVLYTLSIDADRRFNASFAGCISETDVPFWFNASAPTLLCEFTDVGGGVTTYWTFNGTTSAAAPNGTVIQSVIAGILEEYEAPCQ